MCQSTDVQVFHFVLVFHQEELVKQDAESAEVAKAVQRTQEQRDRLQTQVRLWLRSDASPSALSLVTVCERFGSIESKRHLDCVGLVGNRQVEEMNASLQTSQQELDKTTELLKQRDLVITTLENGARAHTHTHIS